MRKLVAVVLAVCFLLSFAACAKQYKKVEEEELKKPVNCATAEGDIRVLENEKAHVAEQIAMGATAIAPPGLVMGLITGTEKTKVQVAIGEYDRMIDEKIKEIKETCGIADLAYVIAKGRIIDKGPPQRLTGSRSPWVRQFMEGLPDGPVPFHYPAEPLETDVLGTSA